MSNTLNIINNELLEDDINIKLEKYEKYRLMRNASMLKYYHKNGASKNALANRKQKYDNDSEYRENLLKKQRDNYAKKKLLKSKSQEHIDENLDSTILISLNEIKI